MTIATHVECSPNYAYSKLERTRDNKLLYRAYNTDPALCGKAGPFSFKDARKYYRDITVSHWAVRGAVKRGRPHIECFQTRDSKKCLW